VPDLGQHDNHIYRNVALSELVFLHQHEYQYELDTEMKKMNIGWITLLSGLLSLMLPGALPLTTGGLLLLPQYR
jgi:hypothetical protein